MELLRPRKLLRMPPRIFKDGQSIECEKKGRPHLLAAVGSSTNLAPYLKFSSFFVVVCEAQAEFLDLESPAERSIISNRIVELIGSVRSTSPASHNPFGIKLLIFRCIILDPDQTVLDNYFDSTPDAIPTRCADCGADA